MLSTSVAIREIADFIRKSASIPIFAGNDDSYVAVHGLPTPVSWQGSHIQFLWLQQIKKKILTLRFNFV